MTGSRDHILNKVRAAKKDLWADSNRDDALKRIQDHEVNLIPERANLDREDRISLFIEEAEKVDASVVRIRSTDQVPREVSRFLNECNAAQEVKIASRLSELPWSSTLLEIRDGAAEDKDAVSVTAAFAGVAETGTLVLTSGPDSPNSLNYLPLTNIAVVEAGKIVGNYERAFDMLRGENKENQSVKDYMPRTMNFITGPSRSGDIDQTILLGAHGPQRLHIIVVDDELL